MYVYMRVYNVYTHIYNWLFSFWNEGEKKSALQGLWDLSSPTADWSRVPCSGWKCRVLTIGPLGKSLKGSLEQRTHSDRHTCAHSDHHRGRSEEVVVAPGCESERALDTAGWTMDRRLALISCLELVPSLPSQEVQWAWLPRLQSVQMKGVLCEKPVSQEVSFIVPESR